MWIALGGAFMTAAYTVRATYLTFFGVPRGAAAVGTEHEGEHLGDELSSHDLRHYIQQEGELETHGEYEASHHAGAVAVHDDHHGDHHVAPHESPKLILIPICILAFLALVAGFTNATAFGEEWENFKEYVEPRPEQVDPATGEGTAAELGLEEEAAAADEAGEEEHATGCGFTAPEEGTACFFPTVSHAEFKWSKALLSLAIVAAGLVSSWFVCVALYTKRDRRLVGLTDRVRPLRAGYAFLANKYYLDDLYEKVIVAGIAGPIARASYWINQYVIDAIVNATGRAGRMVGGWFYRNIDQRVVDGAVDGAGTVATGTGSALRPIQSGKVNQYGALLFGAAAVGAVVLVIVNI
jgi:NADH-quinone oxidoreductase subunit L